MAKLNWAKRNKLERPTLALKDEREYCEHDAAARWMEKHGRVAKRWQKRRQRGRAR